ncbi:MAG: hypothetical protein H6Q90_2690 [Deltaproteobacteria bacterium]|nr:hypothetical protein [Deltaproteobacteria bacterium]
MGRSPAAWASGSVANVPSTGSVVRNLVAPANLGSARELRIPVKGAAPGGEITAISGARVTVVGLTTANSVVATITAEVTTSDNGEAVVQLLDGPAFATSYRLSIVPPASATVGVLFNDPLDLAGDLKRRLPDRIALRGIVRDIEGAPIKDVQVTAHPSLRFQWSLAADPQAFLSTIPAATAVTLETGEFVVFVDPFLNDEMADIWGTYDLAFEPTTVANAPSWSRDDVEIPRDLMQTTVDLANIGLPDAAHVHGRITDPSGNTIEGAELKLFQVNPSLAVLCSEVSHAPTSCPIPALLVGRGSSEGDGSVRLTLPRP